MIPLALKYWPYIVIAVLLAAIGYLQISKSAVIAERDLARQNLVTCQDANAASTQTIGILKAEVAQNVTTCDQRIAAKNSTIKKLRDIDAMKGGADATDSTDDAVLNALNRMQ